MLTLRELTQPAGSDESIDPSIAAAKRRGQGTCVIAQVMTDYEVMETVVAPTRSETVLEDPTIRDRAAAIARAFADPKRLCVLEQLADGERSVSDLSREVGCQVPNMSQHLAVLRQSGLVRSRREGTTVFYRLADERVLEAYRMLQTIAG
jgi:DNA-binding transcriptional ArsR family regulator